MNAGVVIGWRMFTDGKTRDVYLNDDGQYVLDDGKKVRGVWLLDGEADEPRIVGNAPAE